MPLEAIHTCSRYVCSYWQNVEHARSWLTACQTCACFVFDLHDDILYMNAVADRKARVSPQVSILNQGDSPDLRFRAHLLLLQLALDRCL